jgi:NTP pyrophosphatase (non-canonical NTP hydrolase)
MSYADLELKVIHWAEARGIVQNSNNMAQAIKTLEEVTELLEAIHKGDREEIELEAGDVLVTLIVMCATADINLTTCLEKAYKKIQHRKGYLRPDGVFVKTSET